MQALGLVQNKKKSFIAIHNDTMADAHDLKNRYLKLFENLLRVEADQIYQQFEVPSLYLYCTELLELSPSISNDFINVVRKSLEIPELADAVRARKITISKARKICPVITPTDFKQWIDIAEICSTRIVEKAVAQAKPRTAVQESMKYISEDTLEFKLAVSEEWQQLLAKTKDQLSQKYRRAVSSEEALLILMRENFTKNDPVEKAMRAEAKRKQPRANSKMNSSGRSTRHRPAKVEHLVNLRDQNQCAYVNSRGDD